MLNSCFLFIILGAFPGLRRGRPKPGGAALFCALLGIALLSCATTAEVAGPLGSFPLRAAAGEAETPEAAAVQWEPFAPGIEYGRGKIRTPRLEFHALRIDLNQDGLSIVINTGGAAPGGPSGTVSGVKVSSFVRRYSLAAGINTVPFSPVSAREGEPRTITGIVISGGTWFSPPRPEYDALVFYASGKAAIINQGSSFEGVLHALGGFRIILEDGNLPPRLGPGENPDPPRHPRSAAGLSPDGLTLYLLVIDGRRIRSIGATEAETGLVLKALGADSGLNFDGGGSSALALGFRGGRVRTVNTPIHGGIPGRERAVASCLGIRTLTFQIGP